MTVHQSDEAQGTAQDEVGDDATELSLEGLVAHAAGLASAGKLAEAEDLYRGVLAQLAPIHHGLACVAMKREDVETALTFHAAAECLDPCSSRFAVDHAAALLRSGQLLQALGVAEAAAVRLSESADVHAHLGAIRFRQGRMGQSAGHYAEAVRLDPMMASAWNGQALAGTLDGKFSESLMGFRKAVALRPDRADYWSNLAGVCADHGLLQEALHARQRALQLAPDSEDVHATALFDMNCDSTMSPEDIFAAHKEWGYRLADRFQGSRQAHSNGRDPGRRLRIGYVSPDLRSHPVAFFLTPVLQAHDRKSFEVFCYYNDATSDGVTEVLRRTADVWRDVVHLSDAALAEAISGDGIDILVDLSGYTAGNRLGVFARRPAPVQVTYLGYPNTTGLPTMDYRITDAWADPPGSSERLHTEELLRPFQSFLCYMATDGRHLAAKPPMEATGVVTFGSFNHLRKLNPELVALWSRVLERVPGSRLLLKALAFGDAECRDRVAAWFREHGIAAERLTFRPYERSFMEHLATYDLIDIGLDTHPYNGTTTTCEALWMGVPVVTLAGSTHRSRVGASLLQNVDLGELVASSPDEFVERAVALARDPKKLQRLRRELRGQVERSPLMDARGFTHALEVTYRDIWRRWCQR